MILFYLIYLLSKTLHVVEFNTKNWKLSKCSCWKWCKEYKCKHILCFAERKLIFDYPIQAKNVQVGCNRRKGRPQLTASALGYQLNEVESVLSDTASESENPSKKATKRKKVPRS